MMLKIILQKIETSLNFRKEHIFYVFFLISLIFIFKLNYSKKKTIFRKF